MKQQNDFIKAIDNQELVDFSIGKGNYFLPDREYGGHWILGSWLNSILPLLNESNTDIQEHLITMLQELIYSTDIPVIEKSENLLSHLYVFYYLRKENRIPDLDIFDTLLPDISLFLDKVKEDCIANNQLDTLTQMKNTINMIQNNGGLLPYGKV